MTKKIVLSLAATALLAACGDDDDNSGQQQSSLSCQNYCTTVKAACTAANEQYNFIGGPADCPTFCNSVSWAAGTTGSTGNTLACRSDHATLASQSNPDLHCQHAGPTGGALCGNYCDTYCELALEACTGPNQIYASPAECQTACAGLTVGANANLKTGDNVQCRIWHLATAVATPVPHCNHGRVVSTTCI